MKEDKLRILLEQDKNLRDAIRMEEAEGPQMSADLNARLMQRVQHLSANEEKSKKTWWPWIAAACVAGFMMVYLTPPKDTTMGTNTSQTIAEKVEKEDSKQKIPQQNIQQEVILPEAPAKEMPKQLAKSTPAKPKKRLTPVVAEPQIAQETVPAETVSVETLKAETPAIAQTATTTLTEHDIPITRPEKLKYTPEEMALMKKQANEAYLKWVELELEIAKYHLEQTAQNDK